ncbi:MAG: ETC complex I subunit [Alphaproteobacteria bacterium]
MEVRIYRLGKSAMQSGMSRSGVVVAEFAPGAPLLNNDLTGWATMRDTRRQLRLTFTSEAAAVSWAVSQGFAYSIAGAGGESGSKGSERVAGVRSYDDNFSHKRRLPWTH